jgi:hypothetical protein
MSAVRALTGAGAFIGQTPEFFATFTSAGKGPGRGTAGLELLGLRRRGAIKARGGEGFASASVTLQEEGAWHFACARRSGTQASFVLNSVTAAVVGTGPAACAILMYGWSCRSSMLRRRASVLVPWRGLR